MSGFEAERVQQFPTTVLLYYLTGDSQYSVGKHEILELTFRSNLIEEVEHPIVRPYQLLRDSRAVRSEEFGETISQDVVLLLTLFGNEHLQSLPEERMAIGNWDR